MFQTKVFFANDNFMIYYHNHYCNENIYLVIFAGTWRKIITIAQNRAAQAEALLRSHTYFIALCLRR